MSETRIAGFTTMVDPITYWVLSLCECCGSGCDCGCAVDCPLPRHREVGLSGGVKP